VHIFFLPVVVRHHWNTTQLLRTCVNIHTTSYR